MMRKKQKRALLCPICQAKLKEYNKKYYKENRENILNQVKGYYLKNKGKKQEYKKKNKEKIKEYNLKNKEKRNKQLKKYRQNPKVKIKINARGLAQKYIKIPKGQLCEDCNKNLAEHKHHEDYNKPLEVKFLCVKCHIKIKKEWEND